MNVIAFNASPKEENSNTSIMVQSFLQGAQKAGAQVQEVYLTQKKIQHCTGCFSCWFKTPGQCKFRDDMDSLLPLYQSADIVCFATPVYTHNMTAALKNFVDRLIPMKSPLLVQSQGDYDLQDTQTKTTQFVVLANAGFPGENNFNLLSQVFASCNPVLEIYRNCGMALKKDDRRVHAYLQQVQKAGFELAKEQVVTPETKATLQQEMIPQDEYITMLNM